MRLHVPARESLVLRTLTSLPELEALYDEWLVLWERCPWSTPFQHPAWLLAWCKHFRPEQPRVLSLRLGERLVGLAPLLIYREGSRRIVGLIGGGVSDYLDLLFEPALARECGDRLLAYLSDQQSAWDSCRLEQLRLASPLMQLGERSRFSWRHEIQEVCPLLQLPATVEALAARVSPGLLRDARYRRRLIDRRGGYSEEHATAETWDSLQDELLRLHQARWQSRAERGMLADPVVQRFHRESGPKLFAAGLARLCVLRCGGTAIAACYVLVARRHVYCYLSGLAPAFEQFSPGKLVLLSAIETAIRAGDECFDFLRGNERYKYVWGAKDRCIHRLYLEPRPH